MAGVTTFPVVPRPGALRCHEAEHSSLAALARGRSGLRRLGTNAPIAASAPQPRGCSPAGEQAGHRFSKHPNTELERAARPDACLLSPAWGTLLARKVGGGQEWSQTSTVCTEAGTAGWLRAAGAAGTLASRGAAQKLFLPGSSYSRTCVV